LLLNNVIKYLGRETDWCISHECLWCKFEGQRHVTKNAVVLIALTVSKEVCRSRWPRGLRRTSAAARLLGIACSNPTEGMDVCLCLYVVLCCVGRGFCDGLIIHTEVSYRVSMSIQRRTKLIVDCSDIGETRSRSTLD
jgi:hypothetical protein